MSGAPAPYFRQPVGQPRKGFYWNTKTIVWDPVASTDAEAARALKNRRPIGALRRAKLGSRDGHMGRQNAVESLFVSQVSLFLNLTFNVYSVKENVGQTRLIDTADNLWWMLVRTEGL